MLANALAFRVNTWLANPTVPGALTESVRASCQSLCRSVCRRLERTNSSSGVMERFVLSHQPLCPSAGVPSDQLGTGTKKRVHGIRPPPGKSAPPPKTAAPAGKLAPHSEAFISPGM